MGPAPGRAGVETRLNPGSPSVLSAFMKSPASPNDNTSVVKLQCLVNIVPRCSVHLGSAKEVGNAAVNVRCTGTIVAADARSIGNPARGRWTMVGGARR